MPVGTTLRYDEVPLEDFLLALRQHEHDVRVGHLPPQQQLKEVRLEARWTPPGATEASPLTVYLLQERDALSEQVEVFFLLRAPSALASPMRDMALKFRVFLQGRQIPSLFRIDPRFGLVYGSTLDPLDETIRWDKPWSFVTLYLTEDPSSPSLAVMDYVSQGARKRYQELFLKVNQVAPSSPGFLKNAWKRMRGSGQEEAGVHRLSYRLVALLSSFLQNEPCVNATISMIFKELPGGAGRPGLLDPRFATFYPSGHDRFFASLGELA